ncbi:MAG TPA: AsmA family protein, partial [Terriglobales bacterium]
MKLPRHKRRWLFLLALVLLVLYIVRPGANGLRRRISRSIELASGRRVEIGWVKARILPQPGFDLENFVVYDDAQYGSEPMLRAPEVTATLRLRSLLRGRFEIGRLSLKEPSFNLVRGENGHWNLEELLDRAAHIPAAPTGNVKPETRPVFPYIEADDGRINFKIGQEKKAYSLTDADFALWLESDNQWGMRLAAQPVRTDSSLSDTGVLRVSGTWQRSATLRETPLQFTVSWDRAQLGQATKLIYGNDKGWRGGLSLSSAISGTPADLKIIAEATMQDFRRYNIVSSQPLRLHAACEAHYSSIDHALSDVLCRAPVGRGVVTLAGRIDSPTGARNLKLDLEAQNVPLQSLLGFARHAQSDMPEDLIAYGTLDAKLSTRTLVAGQPGVGWLGSGETTDARIQSEVTRVELSLGRVPFVVASDANPVEPKKKGRLEPWVTRPRLEIRPFTVALGKSSTAMVHGWIGRP